MDTQMHPLHFASALSLLLTVLLTPGLAQSRLDRNAPTAQGLLGWWREVPELSGGRTWYDLTGRFHATKVNMDATGTSGSAPTTRPGGQGEVRFDGTNDYATLAVTPSLWPPAVSILMWVKRTATGRDYQGLFTGGDNGGYRDVVLRSTGGMNVSFVTSSFSYLQQDNVNPGSVPLNVWTHIAYTYDSISGLRGYINCVLGNTNGPAGTMYPITTLGSAIGALQIGSIDNLPGTMDDIKLYNRALPAQEVCQVMRDSSRGEPRLLPPSLLVGLLAPVPGAKARFFPFFQAP